MIISPQSHKELVLNKNNLVSIDGTENYPIIKGVPVLLPEKTNPDWNKTYITQRVQRY